MEQAMKTTEGFYKAAEQAAEFGRGNIEAMTSATQTLTSPACRTSASSTMAHVPGPERACHRKRQGAVRVKCLKEATDIQTNFTKASMERTMTETAKLQEASLKLFEASFAPLSARMSIAVETMSKPVTV